MEAIKKANNILAIMVAIGLVLFPIDNHVFSFEIKNILFRLKDFGLLLIICGSIGLLVNVGFSNIKENIIRNKIVVVSLAIIAIIIVIDAIVRANGMYKYYNVVLAIGFILVYFVSINDKDNKIFKFFPYAVIIEAVSCVVQGVLNIRGVGGLSPNPQAWYWIGGIITSSGYTEANQFVANYNLACGYMAFGLIFSDDKWKKILMPIVILAVSFTGSVEGIYITGAILLWMLIKRNYNRQMLYAIGGVGILIVLWFMFGTGQQIWYRLLPHGELTNNINSSPELNHKVSGFRYFVDTFKWYGNGYMQLASSKVDEIAHNVPLVVVQQIGVIPAIAWVTSTAISLKKGLGYILIGVLVMCLMDHYIWTNTAPYWWVAIGVSNRV